MENLGKLLYRQFILNQKKYTLYLLATGLTFFALFFFQAWIKHTVDFKAMMGWYMPVFFIIGLIHSAHAFGDLSTPAKSYQYLLLPASNLEKFVSVWLTASIFYVVAGYIIFLLAAGFGGGLAALLFDYTIDYQSFNRIGHLNAISGFLIIQTIFILGSLTFRSGAFLKTILSVVVFLIALGIVSAIVTRFIAGGFMWDFGSHFGDNMHYEMQELFGHYVPTIAKILYWGIMGPFFLVVSYFKLKESEV
ncbi:MAG: hypothetical protein GVY19_07700 [Bacteroidetes bacterium]|jgi:hypothetical protein|nr:hypothetical protein [Bacteroidota bacterium]